MKLISFTKTYGQFDGSPVFMKTGEFHSVIVHQEPWLNASTIRTLQEFIQILI